MHLLSLVAFGLFILPSEAAKDGINGRHLHEISLSPKEVTMRFIHALFFDFDPEETKKYLGSNYIQHSPFLPTGPKAVLDLLPVIQESGIQMIIHRIIAEGDLVVVHSTYKNAELFGANKIVAFDIFRVKDEKVNEHWDGLQPRVGPNPSGRSMTGGRKKIRDVPDDVLMANKALTLEFVDFALIGGDRSERLAEFIDRERYIQHNPIVGDGLDALLAVFSQVNYSVSELHIVIAQGDFVFVATEGILGTQPTAFFDLFRLSRGKFVEHWDVFTPIPEPHEFLHENGYF